ncbi:MAG: hypothetical protein WCI36_01890 [bacterium]
MEDPKLRTRKRIIILIIFLLIFAATGYFLNYLIAPSATCSDGKQNQSEKGVDCGGVCAPCKEIVQTKDLEIKEVAVAIGGNQTYDVIAKISNPNEVMGSKEFGYTFTLKDAEGKVLATKQGKTFILPSDTRYIPELGLKTENDVVPSSVDFVLDDISWEKLTEMGKPQLGVYNKNVKEVNVASTQADAVIRNESGLYLKKIYVTVVLRSKENAIIGINKTEINSVRQKEQRDFNLVWPYALSAPVANIEIDPQSNVFDVENLSSM